MSPAERVARVRDAVARARHAVAHVRALLTATERVLTVLEALLVEERPNVVLVRRALDALGPARRASDEALHQSVEAADRMLDALGAGTRLVT